MKPSEFRSRHIKRRGYEDSESDSSGLSDSSDYYSGSDSSDDFPDPSLARRRNRRR